ncbi:MAG: hypothetical protein ABIW85_02105 [Variovorax sp.]
MQGHNQITDLYLLALAVKNAGRLVSLDQAIALSSVKAPAPSIFTIFNLSHSARLLL